LQKNISIEYLGVKRDTVYKWVNEKNMPAHKIGRLWKFKKEHVDKWVEGGGAVEASLKINSNNGDANE